MEHKTLFVHRIAIASILLIALGGCRFFPPPGESRFIKEEGNEKVIVFVHGVGGTIEDTWAIDEDSPSWPELVKNDPADILKEFDVYSMTYYEEGRAEDPSIFRLAVKFNEILGRDKIFPKKYLAEPERYKEVYFVAHSMGNLVIRTALLIQKPPKKVKIPLLVSLASPSLGSNIAELGEQFIGEYPQFKDMVGIEKNSFLSLLNKQWDATPIDTEIACAYEEEKMSGLGLLIVDQKSATEVCTRKEEDGGYKGLPGDHRTIVKPPKEEGKEFPAHTWLKEQIARPVSRKGWELERWVKPGDAKIIIGGKDYLESNIHLEIMAQVIENAIEKGIIKDLKRVERKYALGNSVRTFYELRDRDIDLYSEYSGSIYHEHLNINPISHEGTPTKLSHASMDINKALQGNPNTLGLISLPHFQEHNAYVMVMKAKEAQGKGSFSGPITTIADLAKAGKERSAKAGRKRSIVVRGLPAFMYRLDGLPGLKEAYGFEAGDVEPQYIEHRKVYDKLDDHQHYVVAVGYGTDWQLNHHDTSVNYVQLKDNLEFFPRYLAGPFMHEHVLEKFCGIGTALSQFAGIEKDYCRLQKTASGKDIDENITAKTISLKDMACLLHQAKAKGIKLQNLSAENEAGTKTKNNLRDLVRSFLQFKRFFKSELSSEGKERFSQGCAGIYHT